MDGRRIEERNGNSRKVLKSETQLLGATLVGFQTRSSSTFNWIIATLPQDQSRQAF